MKLFLLAAALTVFAVTPSLARENIALRQLLAEAGATAPAAVPAPAAPKSGPSKAEPAPYVVDCTLDANSDMHVRLKILGGVATEAAFDNWDWSSFGPFTPLTPVPAKTPASDAQYASKEGPATHSFIVSRAVLEGKGTLYVDGMSYHCP